MRILVIEDDADAAAYVIKALKEAGHVPDHVGDGEAGTDHPAFLVRPPEQVHRGTAVARFEVALEGGQLRRLVLRDHGRVEVA